VDDDAVLLEVRGGVAVLTLNRPDEHNLMGVADDALFFRYLDLVRTDRDVRVLVWRGNGPSFSMGRDTGEVAGDQAGAGDGDADGTAGRGATGGRARARWSGVGDNDALRRAHWGARLLYDFPVPIICALKGWSLGTAFERALLCDLRVAGESAKMALAAPDHGVIPDSAGVAKLFEVGGAGLALDLALTGRHVGADEALRLGLVSRVVPDDDLDRTVADLARSIAERPPLVTRLVREHVAALATPAVRGALGRELVGQTMVLASYDYHEHHRARAEDREPRYQRR
jgi:enoyl-CoA hydratase